MTMPTKRLGAGLCLLGVLALQGCGAIGGITGAVAGVASGSASGSPAVGIAVGIGVKAGVDATVKYVWRSWTAEEQQRVADAIGDMTVGQRRSWQVRHPIPYDDKQGEITVVRAFDTPLASCKEAVFSARKAGSAGAENAGSPAEPNFVTVACRGAAGWRWAAAEPAVGRWQALQ